MSLHRLLAARSSQPSRGSPGLRQPQAALGFLFPSLGMPHQENLPRRFGMDGATWVLEPCKPRAQPDPTAEPRAGAACRSPCPPSPRAGRGRAAPLEQGDLPRAADPYQPSAQLLPASGQCDSLEGEQTQPVSCGCLLPRGAQAQWPGHGTHPGGEGEGCSDRRLQ